MMTINDDDENDDDVDVDVDFDWMTSCPAVETLSARHAAPRGPRASVHHRSPGPMRGPRDRRATHIVSSKTKPRNGSEGRDDVPPGGEAYRATPGRPSQALSQNCLRPRARSGCG